MHAVRVIPRSHLGLPPTPEGNDRWLPHPQEALLDLHAGDLVVLHSDLIHSGTPNASNSLRMYTSTYICRIGLPHRDDFNADVIRRYVAGARTSGDSRVLRFFGEASEQWRERQEAEWAAVAATEKAQREQQKCGTTSKL